VTEIINKRFNIYSLPSWHDILVLCTFSEQTKDGHA